MAMQVVKCVAKISGILYTFGKLNAKTHFFYEALPSPGIAALRIQADIRYTEDPSEQNLWWDLPEGIRPDLQETKIESVKPTKNLLGWAPAKRLTADKLNFFKSSEIDADFMPDTFSYPNYVYKMFDKIDQHFAQCSRSGVSLPFSSLHLNGFLVQGMAIKKHHEPSKFDRSVMSDSLNKSAVISGYRVAKEPTGDRHSWSCYDFDEYKHVPQSWIHSRNSVRIHLEQLAD